MESVGEQPITEELTPKDVEQLASELAELDPRPVTFFTPDNLDEVMTDFLDGKIENPNSATYSKLDAIDFQKRADEYSSLLGEIFAHPEIPVKHHHVYQDFVDRALKINELMAQAVEYRTANDPEVREKAKKRFTEINSGLYGEPDVAIGASMVREVLSDSKVIDNPEINAIRDEFSSLLPSYLTNSDHLVTLEPSEGAKEVASRCVEHIYGPLLKHADELLEALAQEEGVSKDDLKVGPQAIAVIFQTIIDKEFSDSGWKTVIEPANAINVGTATKEIKIPSERVDASPNKVRGLVVHELGIHMLRSIIGEKADLIPMRFGLAGVGEAEEGLAKIMESVVTDDASRTGYQHYLTATLLNNGLDFRQAFEIMWRYKVLDAYMDKPKEITESFIEIQKRNTFKFMFRSIRGTNELPWHTTLDYFNGTHKMWDYVDRHQDDFNLVSFMFMGKSDPTNPSHMHGVLDAKSRIEA